MRPPLTILDTSVVVSGLASSYQSPSVRLLAAAMEGRVGVLLSPALLAEYERVLRLGRITRLHKLSPEQLETYLVDLVSAAVVVEPSPAGSAPDPGDDHLWALLAHNPDSILVTHDAALLASPPPGRIVISPAEFVRRWPV